jgi:hypothetical protein
MQFTKFLAILVSPKSPRCSQSPMLIPTPFKQAFGSFVAAAPLNIVSGSNSTPAHSNSTVQAHGSTDSSSVGKIFPTPCPPHQLILTPINRKTCVAQHNRDRRRTRGLLVRIHCLSLRHLYMHRHPRLEKEHEMREIGSTGGRCVGLRLILLDGRIGCVIQIWRWNVGMN